MSGECQHARRHGSRPRAQRALELRARHRGPTGRVERHEVQREARVQHARRRLGVDVDVELRRRRHVAPDVHRPAHRDDAPDPSHRRGIGFAGQGDVGQRPESDERQPGAVVPRLFHEELDRTRWPRPGLDLRPVAEGAQAVGAVITLGRLERARERRLGARGDERPRLRAAQGEQAEQVDRALAERDVAGHRRDRLHPHPRRSPRQE